MLPALIALFFSLLLAACTQKQAGSRLRKVGDAASILTVPSRPHRPLSLPSHQSSPCPRASTGPCLCRRSAASISRNGCNGGPSPPASFIASQARALLKQKSQALRQVGDLAATQQQANEEAQAQLRAQQATERWRIETMVQLGVQRRLKALGRSSGGGLLAGRSSQPPSYQADSIEMPPSSSSSPRAVGWFFGRSGRSRSSLRTTSFNEGGARTTDQASSESPYASPRVVAQGSTISAAGSETPSETPSECARSHVGPVVGPAGASLVASPTSHMSLSSKRFFGRRRMMHSGRVQSRASTGQPSGQPSSDRASTDVGIVEGEGARMRPAASGEQQRSRHVPLPLATVLSP